MFANIIICILCSFQNAPIDNYNVSAMSALLPIIWWCPAVAKYTNKKINQITIELIILYRWTYI